jgi:LysM domain-containing protein
MTLIKTTRPGAPTGSRPVQVRPTSCHFRPKPEGPRPSRPAGGPLRYRGTGVLNSTAPHRPRPITPATTVALALLAALITVWLGLVAQFGDELRGGSDQTAAQMPDRLAVVRVDPGETLQHLAARVAPDAPIGQVAQRIRELNGLDSATVTAGQTLIAPVG